MEVSYKRDFHHSYLILKDQTLPDCDTYGIRMLLNSKIPGLLSCTIHKVDNQALFYYETTSRQTLASMYETQKINRDMMVLLIGALMRTLEEMEAYLLSPKMLLLQPEYIYYNVAERELGFVYWPGEVEEKGGFLELTEYLLPRIDHQDQAAVVLGYQLYRRAMEDQINTEEIRRELYQETMHLEKMDASPKSEVVQLSSNAESEKEEILEVVLRGVKEEAQQEQKSRMGICIGLCILLVVLYLYFMRNQYFSWVVFAIVAGVCLVGSGIAAVIWWIRKKRKTERKADLVEVPSLKQTVSSKEDDLPDIMEEAQTTLLFAKSIEDCGRLQAVSPKGLADIPLQKGNIVLGKMTGAVDVVLPSSAVSRIHAKVKTEQESEVFDLNSKNGTYVNHVGVTGSRGIILHEGDLVTFADLVYRYTTMKCD